MGQCVAKPAAADDIVVAADAPAACMREGGKPRGGKARARIVRKGSKGSARAAAAVTPTPICAAEAPIVVLAASPRSPRVAVPDALAAAAARRVAHTPAASSPEAQAERVASLRSLEQLLPRRESGGAAQLARRSSVPTAPGVLFTHLQQAILNGTAAWATSSEQVSALLAEDIEYVDLRGEVALGKHAALESMDAGAQKCASQNKRCLAGACHAPRSCAPACLPSRRIDACLPAAGADFFPLSFARARAGMERLLRRISRSTRSGKNDHIKVKADGPKACGRGVWVTVFTFKLCVSRARRQHAPAPACAAHVMACECRCRTRALRSRHHACACACTDRRSMLCCGGCTRVCARTHHRHRRLRRRSLRSYLMAVRIQEAYTFDAHGRIVRLERCMANAAQAKLVTA
jgi:hypothetical protein